MKFYPILLSAAALCYTAHAQYQPNPPLPPQMSADEQSVWQAENDWSKAYIAGDTAKLDQIESKNYVFTDGGYVHNAADERADMKAGLRFTEMSLHEAIARITGDTAVVVGRLVLSGSSKTGMIDEEDAFTDTWVRSGTTWQVVASSDTRIAKSSKSAVSPLWRDGGGWLRRHADFVEEAKKNPDVDLLFVGDSITDFWRNRGKVVFDKYYGQFHTANIGISGDRTQHVLWRIDHGEVDGYHPKAIVLMIGTNNTLFERDKVTPRNTPAEAADGVKAIVNDLRKRMPDAKILLLAVFPRGHSADDPGRAQVAAINRVIAGLDDGDHVHYLDIGPKFLTADGTLEADIMPDFLHPSVKGYEIWAQAIQPQLTQLMGSTP